MASDPLGAKRPQTPGRPNQTAVDYVTIVLSPVLIMGLIGSLVFFLLEIFYASDGPWKGRLQWILFFYVFGAVLVGRISMNGEIASRAKLYGSVLALAAYFGLSAFVEYPADVRPISFFINLVLVGVVWWCAYKLAWDCTNVDEETDMSGEGLLQASGLVGTMTSPNCWRRRSARGSPAGGSATSATARRRTRSGRWGPGSSTSHWRRCRSSAWGRR